MKITRAHYKTAYLHDGRQFGLVKVVFQSRLGEILLKYLVFHTADIKGTPMVVFLKKLIFAFDRLVDNLLRIAQELFSPLLICHLAYAFDLSREEPTVISIERVFYVTTRKIRMVNSHKAIKNVLALNGLQKTTLLGKPRPENDGPRMNMLG